MVSLRSQFQSIFGGLNKPCVEGFRVWGFWGFRVQKLMVQDVDCIRKHGCLDKLSVASYRPIMSLEP